MLEGSFWELALIFVLALIVFGPERLPGLARTMGLWIGRARAVLRNLSNQLERELAADELRKTAAEVRQTLDPSMPSSGRKTSGSDVSNSRTVKRDDATG
ncbi:MAG TPA: Sec-independent protein translocase protein TatB [Gammaproteobacteria bacterium]|nr:Sec-independent protein translocase protein TatB [Gammaproteobacteria bacterium]